MLNILFWNLKGNAVEDYIVNCIVENDVDIAVFSEFKGIDFNKIEKQLGMMYAHITSVQEDRKVTMIAKKTFWVSIVQQEKRYNIYNIKTAVKDYLLVALHLEDRIHYEPDERKGTIRDLVQYIEQSEETFKCPNTIVVGDFNANPYDEELLSKSAFNSVLFKEIIDKNEYSNPKSSKRKRFYNPIMHYISEDTKMYGSFYYEKHTTPYWHCLDQILVRKSLMNNVKNVEYLKRIDVTDLLKNAIPDKRISDHLPMLVKLMEVENGD